MINKVLIFALLAILPAAFSSAQQGQETLSLISEADVLIAQKQLDEALQRINEALEAEPENIEAIRRQINIFYLLEDDKEAMRLADIAVEKHPSDPVILYLRGLINNMLGKYSKAIEDFDESIKDASGDITYKIYLGRGISYMNLLEYEDAMTDITKSVSLNDTNGSAYQTRAMLNYELKEYEAAINDFTRALELSEGTAVLYFNLGMSYYRLEETAEACPYFQKSCSMGNNNACKMILMECAREIPDVR